MDEFETGNQFVCRKLGLSLFSADSRVRLALNEMKADYVSVERLLQGIQSTRSAHEAAQFALALETNPFFRAVSGGSSWETFANAERHNENTPDFEVKKFPVSTLDTWWSSKSVLAQPAKGSTESPELMQARRYLMCVNAKLKMPDSEFAPMPRGVGGLAITEGVSRQTFSASVRKHIRRLNSS